MFRKELTRKLEEALSKYSTKEEQIEYLEERIWYMKMQDFWSFEDTCWVNILEDKLKQLKES